MSPRFLILAACSGILGAAALLHPGEPGDSRLRLGGVPLPGLCMMRSLTGVPCPGCGLTRSIVAAVHGDLSTSFFFHRLGLAVLVYVVLQALHSILWLASPWWRARGTRFGTLLDRGLLAIALLLAINWGVTLGSLLHS